MTKVSISQTVHPAVVCKASYESDGESTHAAMVTVDMARFTITIENDAFNESIVWEFDPLDENSPLYMSATLASLADALTTADGVMEDVLNGKPVSEFGVKE